MRHTYTPEPSPTRLGRLWGRATTHAVELVVVVATALLGVKVAVILADRQPPALERLPEALVYGASAFMVLGAALAAKGLLVRREDVRRELNAEQIGWALMLIGGLGYAVTLDLIIGQGGGRPGGGGGRGLGIGPGPELGYFLAAASAWRVYALWRIERQLDAVKDAIEGAAP